MREPLRLLTVCKIVPFNRTIYKPSDWSRSMDVILLEGSRLKFQYYVGRESLPKRVVVLGHRVTLQPYHPGLQSEGWDRC